MTRRAWRLGSDAPLALQIAADARFSKTDYADDHTWELSLGSPGNPALSFFTRYGGRVGLLSVVPTWWIDSQPLYEYQSYSSAPVVTAFAPGYLAVEAHLNRDLALQAEYYVLDSHTVGIRFTLKNTGSANLKINVDLITFAAAQKTELKPTLMRSLSGDPAMAFGECGDLDPVMILENGSAVEGSRKLTTVLAMPPKGTSVVRAVVASLTNRNQSRQQAANWLGEDWSKPVLSGARSKIALPKIETGNHDLDTVLAFSYQQAMQAFIKPRSKLPHPSFVANRQPDAGYRPAPPPTASATMLAKTRTGQNPTQAYLLALAVAPIEPNHAKGIIRNYLSVQKADGWIDWSPGMDGSMRNLLCLPILARLTWGIWQYTTDSEFLGEVFPGLLKFLKRWLAPDLDADKDGVPEWQSEAQTAYPFLPIFSRGLTVGQNADIRFIESPDLLAYLLSEAISLREMAINLKRDDDERSLNEMVDTLRDKLENFWRNGLARYAHRDRDTHFTAASEEIMRDRPANESFGGGHTLASPTRLLVEVVGGTTRPNSMKLILDGAAPDGTPIKERAEANAFAWTAGRGSYTSQNAFARIDRIACEGVIPMYKVSVRTLDTSPLDITALLPLWAVAIHPQHARLTARLMQDPAHFWRKHGTIMFSATDPNYQPDQNEFAAGVWGFWLTLLGEALIEAGNQAAAADLLHRYFAGMIPVVKQNKAFYEGYHAEKAEGIGIRGHINGIAPLHLFLRVVGIRIISESLVFTGGPFVWNHPVTMSHQGVTVRRAVDGTSVKFPSGEVITLPPDAAPQWVAPSTSS